VQNWGLFAHTPLVSPPGHFGVVLQYSPEAQSLPVEHLLGSAALAEVDATVAKSASATKTQEKLVLDCYIISLNYSAQDKYEGMEAMFFSKKLVIPDVANPSKLKVA
jgi:hypothetical protein